MPRAGLDRVAVVAAGADVADEVGFAGLSMGALAQRLGVRAPSLYRHVANQEDLNRAIAALALTQAGDAVGAAIQGRAGRDALAAAAQAFHDFVLTHPGRYAATIGIEPTDAHDPIAIAGAQLMASFAAVLRSYTIAAQDSAHALRTLRAAFHGFATLQLTNSFQWPTDTDDSFEWLITFLDRGLRATTPQRTQHTTTPFGVTHLGTHGQR